MTADRYRHEPLWIECNSLFKVETVAADAEEGHLIPSARAAHRSRKRLDVPAKEKRQSLAARAAEAQNGTLFLQAGPD